MNQGRLLHSYTVGKKMMEIGRSFNLSEDEINDLFVLGLNHDIGYELNEDTSIHGEVGAEVLKRNNYKYYQEVYYHGRITDKYSSMFLDILNMADMQVDKDGNDVGYESRLKDIESRYGIDSIVYKRCVELINYLKERENYYKNK